MGAFLVRRVLSGLLLVAMLTFLTFVVFNEIPTNPACLVVACGPLAAGRQLGRARDPSVRPRDHDSRSRQQPAPFLLGGVLPIDGQGARDTGVLGWFGDDLERLRRAGRLGEAPAHPLVRLR